MRFLAHLPEKLRWAFLGILMILIVASAMTTLLSWFQPTKNHTELRLRVKSWWVMAGIFAVVLILPRPYAIGFFGFLSFLALKEYFSIIPTRRADRRVLLWAYLAIPIQYLWVGTAWYGMFVIFIPVYLFLFIPMRMILIGETEGFLRAVGTIHWGLMAMVFGLSHLAYFLVLEGPHSTPGSGASLLLLTVFLTQFNDVAQFIWGKLFGRTKVIPKVSPNKTVEGLIGGVATTVVLAALLGPWLTRLNLSHSVLGGLIIGLGGFIGDVTISALKRDLGIKDSGSLIPGHGGILDRVDSLLCTAPLFFHFVRYLNAF